jgi:hypothetical protein
MTIAWPAHRHFQFGIKRIFRRVDADGPDMAAEILAAVSCPPRPDRMVVNEPQKDLLVVGILCPVCKDIAATRVADLRVDRQNDTVSAYPWRGSPNDFVGPEWRKFIDRSGGSAAG